MAADIRMVVTIFILLGGFLSLIAVWGKAFKSKNALRTAFMLFGIAAVGFGVVSLVGQLGIVELPASVSPFFLSSAVEANVPSGNGNTGTGSNVNVPPPANNEPNFQPTASYTTKDKYSTTTIVGTSYYKVNNDPATTTAQTNVNKGSTLKYWVDNGTYWVRPLEKSIVEGVNPFVADAYQNGTVSVSLYDQVGRASATNGASNVSMGATKQANIEVSYQGPSEKSGGPFGGLMVAEYNSTISTVTCVGDDLLTQHDFHLTYTTSATTHTYKTWAYGPSLDDGSGNVRRINCQFKNGATGAGAGSTYYFKFIPANYYVSDAGDILLDTEKFASGETTRTGSIISLPSVTGYWGA